MAVLKLKEIKKMSEKEINEKIKDLRMELIKSQIAANKGGKLKTREIKRTIARLHTINRLNKIQKTNEFSAPKKSQKKIFKESVEK